jgi:hypothetical protein
VKVTIRGQGELVPSWQAGLGLQGDFEGTKRWAKVEIEVPAEAKNLLDRDISGVYTLLPKCGQAMISLHKRETSTDSQPTLFLFLDPTRCGEADDDSYVFSTSTERLDYGTERAVVARLDPKWRESTKAREEVRLDVRGGWIKCDEAHLTALGGADIAVVPSQDGVVNGHTPNIRRDRATYAVPTSASSLSVDLDNEACTHATALLCCRVPLDPSHSEAMWRKGQWGEIDLLHQGNTTFANLAWITERLPGLEAMSEWTKLKQVDVSSDSRSLLIIDRWNGL